MQTAAQRSPTRTRRLEPSLAGLLGRLRSAIRRYVWLQGLGWTIVWLGLAFWMSLAIDWLFEPPPAVRIGILVVAALGLVTILYRFVLRRAFARLRDDSLALLLERRFPALGGSLATVVDLADRPPERAEYDPQMLAWSEQLAVARARQLDVRQVFDRRPLTRALTAAGLLSLTVVGFAAMATWAFEIWVERNLLLSNVLWPRQTELVVDGFQDGVVKIARGSDFDLVAQAALRKQVPETVEVRYRTEEGARGRENMSQQGVAVAGADEYQPFVYTFKGVLVSIDLDVIGGDDRVEDLRIEVVDSPTAAMTLDCEYPEYMHRQPIRGVPASGVVPFPQGSRITIHGRANKDLVAVEVERLDSGNTADSTSEPPSPLAAKVNARSFTVKLDQLQRDEVLLFTLLDTDGIRNRQPLRLTLAALPDEPPQVLAQLVGIGSAITPKARVPAAGVINDDYGLSRAWFEYQIAEQAPQEREFPVAADGKFENQALDVSELGLTPGQKLLVGIKAADTRDLGPDQGSNIGTGQRYLLDVVTPEDLRAILEGRELVLRQRLETIIDEFTETRDSLDRVELPIPPRAAMMDRAAGDLATRRSLAGLQADGSDEPSEESRADSNADAAGGVAPAPEVPPPTDAPAPADPATEAAERDRILQLSGLRVQRALQNAQRAAHETQALATAFDDIRAELVNNRIDSEELRARLKDGIADPLRSIAGEQFPLLEERLHDLERRLEDAQHGSAALIAARQQSDVILIQLKQVLDKMIEMESFTEVLDMLRSIIDSQESVQQQTEQRRNERALELLEE